MFYDRAFLSTAADILSVKNSAENSSSKQRPVTFLVAQKVRGDKSAKDFEAVIDSVSRFKFYYVCMELIMKLQYCYLYNLSYSPTLLHLYIMIYLTTL
jgi:hypothetical protein